MVFTLFNLFPKTLNLTVGLLLGDFSVALQSYNQTHPIGERFQILMKSKPL